MPTLGQLTSELSRKLLDPNNIAVAVDDVMLAINQAIDYYKVKRFWFNQASATITTVPANPVSPLPPDFLFELPYSGFVLQYNTLNTVLAKIAPEQFDWVSSGGGQGLPRAYTWNGGIFSLYPAPDQAYSVQINYVRDYPALSNSSDSNDFTENADRAVAYNALSRLFGELRQDEKMEAYYTGRATDELNRLITRTAKSTATGRLQTEQLFQGSYNVW